MRNNYRFYHNSRQLYHASIIALILLLTACSSSSDRRYKMNDDAAPNNTPDVTKVEDAHPKFEPYSRGGNSKSYTVRGKTYRVLDTGKGYQQAGIASWYGAKFHGHLTSNGETYDMYSMSAAHKTLPIPSYAKITNLANNKSVVVRVNDRGPFHDERLIDLSYAAAHRLDMLKTGTARVNVEVIYIESPESTALAELKNTDLHYVQVVASSDKQRITQLGNQLANQYQVKTRILQAGNLYKLQLGPIGRQQIATELHQTLQQNGFPQSYVVTE